MRLRRKIRDLVDVSVNVAQVEHLDARFGKRTHILETFVAKSHHEGRHRLALDEIAKLQLVLLEIGWTTLTQACEERHALVPPKQEAQHCDDAHLAI